MNVIFNFTLKFNGFPIQKAKLEFDRIKNLNDSSRVNQILNFHILNNAFYKDFLLKNKVDFSVPFDKLPIITKKDFQVDIDSIITEGFKKGELHIHNTSGSTGTPFYFAKDKFCHAMNWAEIDYHLLKHGVNIGDSKQARFYGIPLGGIKYYKERLKDILANRYRYPVFDLSDEKLEKILFDFGRIKFEYINGYTSSLVLFAKFLLKKGIILKDVCPTLKVVFPTSEVVDDIDREIMESAFGVCVRNEYGAAELDILAFQDSDGDFVLNEETLYIEILNDNNEPVVPGEEGRVIVTSLYNKAMPFIRYDLGDRAILKDKLKNGKRVLERIVGRTNDVIYLPSGKVSPGLTFYYISKKLLESGGKIKEFIVQQKQLNLFEIQYVSDTDLSENDKLQIQKAMDLYLEQGLTCDFNKVEIISRTKAGKLKHFFSELN